MIKLPKTSSTGSSKPNLKAVTEAAKVYIKAELPEEYYADMHDKLLESVLTAYNTEKPDARAFASKDNKVRIEMRSELVRTPHTTLEDKIKFQLYIIPNKPAAFFP
jgi:hypothetical protein